MSEIRKAFRILIIVLMALSFSACGRKEEIIPIDDDSTDQMFDDTVYGDIVYLFQMDGETFMIEPSYQIWMEEYDLKDGCFYRMKADITYLNGGIAGYYNFPDKIDVISVEEVSPFDLDLPEVSEKRYGLTLIGDYGEGDIFLHEYRKMALWKDGEWIWHYDRQLEREDGTMVCYRSDVGIEQIEEGIGKGILSCPEYFLQPAIASE